MVNQRLSKKQEDELVEYGIKFGLETLKELIKNNSIFTVEL